jgi:hypothetical protein
MVRGSFVPISDVLGIAGCSNFKIASDAGDLTATIYKLAK